MRNIIIGLALMLVSCAQGKTDEITICSEDQFETVPVLPGAGSNELYEIKFRTKTSDIADALDKIKDFGDVSVNLKSVSFSTVENSDLDFVNRVELSYVSNNNVEFLGKSDVIHGTNIPIKFNRIPDQLKQELLNGPVLLETKVVGKIPSQALTPKLSLCVSAQAKFDVSLLKSK